MQQTKTGPASGRLGILLLLHVVGSAIIPGSKRDGVTTGQLSHLRAEGLHLVRRRGGPKDILRWKHQVVCLRGHQDFHHGVRERLPHLGVHRRPGLGSDALQLLRHGL